MLQDSQSHESSLSIEAQERIAEQLILFSKALKKREQPTIESFLRGFAGAERAELLRELLLVEIEHREQWGEWISFQGYQQQFSSDPDVVAAAQAEYEEQRSTGANAPKPPTFPGFEVLEEISPGVGGMGMVFRARDLHLLKIRAIKTPKAHMTTEEGREFFVNEARNAARLDHPNIVKIFSLNPDHAPPFYVMEYVAGRPLDQASEGKDPRTIARLLEQTARALAYAHVHGVIHRDIKPGNILVDFDEMEPHITDFGLAERWDHFNGRQVNEDTSFAGTAQFIPPEVYAGSRSVTPAVDVYALGVTMYRLLCGRYPFPGRNVVEVREHVMEGEPPMPQEINPEVSEPLQRICLKAMERDPTRRYESAELMANALRRFLERRKVLDRPTRYDAELAGKIQNYETEIHAWQEQKLISLPDMDRLLRSLSWFKVRLESPWQPSAPSFAWETIGVRLGAWLVLLASLLWLIFYWSDLSPTMRLCCVGFPTLVMNALGWFFYRRKSKWNMRMFLGTGALLLPLFVAVLLDEYDVLGFYQGEEKEFFSPEGRKKHITPTNLQLTLAAAVFVAYCVLLVRSRPIWLFLMWLGIGIYFLFTGVLLRSGLKEWLAKEDIAFALMCYLILCLLFPLGSMLWYRNGGINEASWLYCFFPMPLVVLMTLLARYGSTEWLNVSLETEGFLVTEAINLWWMANGVIYCLLGIMSVRATTRFARYWGSFFLLLVPTSFLTTTNLMLDRRGIPESSIGGNPVTLYELLCGTIAVGFVIVGTKISRWTLTVPGLVGLAVFIFRVTERHFQDHLSWPLALAIAGGIVMLVGLISTYLRFEDNCRADFHARLIHQYEGGLGIGEVNDVNYSQEVWKFDDGGLIVGPYSRMDLEGFARTRYIKPETEIVHENGRRYVASQLGLFPAGEGEECV